MSRGRKCNTRPIPTWTEVERGLLAGWLEGEGTFVVSRREGKRPQVSIAGLATDQDVVEKMGQLVGANIRTRPVKNREHKPVWRFSLSGPRAITVMMEIYSLLGERRKAAVRNCLTAWEHSA